MQQKKAYKEDKGIPRRSSGITLNIQETIQSQLDQFYASIANERENRVKVRNWQVTVLLVFVGYLLSDKVAQQLASGLASFSLLLSVVVVFWTIEAFYQSLVLALLHRAGRLEDLIADQEYVPQTIPRDLFYVNGWHTVSALKKMKYFIAAFARCRSIVLFNLLLIVFSFVLAMVRSHPFVGPSAQ